MSIKQPWLGFIGLLVAITLSLSLIASFDAATFSTWGTFYAVTCVPVQIVLSLVLRCEYPPFVRELSQPAKGIALLVIMFVVAAAISSIAFFTIGGGVSPPNPVPTVYVIFAVVVTFWFAVVWGGWPVTALTKNASAIATSILLVTHLGAYLLFEALFDFSFMAPAPVYVAALDPAGAFHANYVLSFAVSSVAILFVCILFDFWPVTSVPAWREQPLMGLVTTLWILAVTAIVWGIGVHGMGFDPIAFMVHGSIALLFGCLVPVVLHEGKLFESLPQPARGGARLLLAVGWGIGLSLLYRSLMPIVTGELPQGPGAGYQAENWLASALLAITFPMMVVVAEMFQFWPWRRQRTG